MSIYDSICNRGYFLPNSTAFTNLVQGTARKECASKRSILELGARRNRVPDILNINWLRESSQYTFRC